MLEEERARMSREAEVTEAEAGGAEVGGAEVGGAEVGEGIPEDKGLGWQRSEAKWRSWVGWDKGSRGIDGLAVEL
jgi:hypothetical protein